MSEKYYIDLYTLDTSIIDKCVTYLEGHTISEVTYDFVEKNCFTISVYNLTDAEIAEMEDMFPMQVMPY